MKQINEPKLPEKELRRTLTVAIDEKLLIEVKKIAEARGLTLRDAVHFGLQQFLWATRKDKESL